MKSKNCICCGKELKIAFGRTMFCSKCSLYSKNKAVELGALKYKCEQLELKYNKLKNQLANEND